MYSSILSFAAVSAIFRLASSQQIDPNSVALSTRASWCTSQVIQCPLICTQETDGSATTLSNTCDPASLAYSCVCDNGLSPNISEYSQTIPYFECTEYGNQCVQNCGMNNNQCASACRQNNPCGAQNPTRVNVTSTTSGTASATGSGSSGSGSAVYTGFGAAATSSGSSTSSSSGSSSSSSTSSSGAGSLLVDVGRLYGLGVVTAGILAGFAVLL